ncbi:MAG: DUF2390 domain-containing protein [Kangiellaceae bacterium]|nr:DUF2390 domain-containing protein [Kangiellaceae bacterium]
MQTPEYKSRDMHDAFWNAGCNFYEKKTNQNLLLSLQDGYGLNVNRLLFSCWFSLNFQILLDIDKISKEPESFSELDASVSQLRDTRRNFEDKWKKPIIGHYNMARYHLLESELSLEKESQSLLVAYYCRGKAHLSSAIDEISLDLLIMENLERLCLDASLNNTLNKELPNKLIQLSLDWIYFEH